MTAIKLQYLYSVTIFQDHSYFLSILESTVLTVSFVTTKWPHQFSLFCQEA